MIQRISAGAAERCALHALSLLGNPPTEYTTRVHARACKFRKQIMIALTTLTSQVRDHKKYVNFQ